MMFCPIPCNLFFPQIFKIIIRIKNTFDYLNVHYIIYHDNFVTKYLGFIILLYFSTKTQFKRYLNFIYENII